MQFESRPASAVSNAGLHQERLIGLEGPHLGNVHTNPWSLVGLHYVQLAAQGGILLAGVDVGVFHSGIENHVSESGDENNSDEQSYREFFAKGSLIIIGLLLFSRGSKPISYAVDRSKAVFVLAVALIALGFSALLYVGGFFAAL
jgi:hypothetical protein